MNTVNDLRQKTEDVLADLDPIQHLRNLDFPRRSGTEGERKAADYVARALEHNGIEPVRQEFHYAKPKVLPRLILPLVLLVWALLSLANIQFLDSNLAISLLVLSLPLALILTVLNMNRVMRYFFGRRRKKLQQVETQINDGTLSVDQVITSQNVIAEIGPEDAEKQILFTAHFDSISSKIPMRVMTPGILVGFMGLILYSLLYLANVITGLLFELNFMALYFPIFATFALVTLALLEIYFLARLFRGNESHGIIDDGTGVAILLELAKFVKNHEIPDHKFTFGFFGAEESGLVGSAHYYINHAIDKSKLHVISIDMIGERPPLAYVKGIYPVRRLHMDPAFNTQIESIARAFDIEIKGKSFPYPGSDFGHFLLDGGCTTNWLISQSRLIHSKLDNLSNVSEELVIDALKLMVAYLLRGEVEEQAAER